jgi:FAD:protein FMN transferase
MSGWLSRLLCLCWLTSLHAAEWQLVKETHPAMGTLFQISCYTQDPSSAKQAIRNAFQRVDQLEQIASDYRADSELSHLMSATTPVTVSADLRQLLQQSIQLCEQTEHSFDITSGQLTRLWRRSRNRSALPSPEQLQRALQHTGIQRLTLKDRTAQVQPDTWLDLGGIAKGYAADTACLILQQQGHPHAAVAASGDLSLGAAPPGQSGWEVKLRTFEKPEQQDTLYTLRLSHCGVSTSGDLHQFILINGQRYSHIIHPRTGLGLTQRIACTVIAPTTTQSDALATAMCILGPERGCSILGKTFPQVQARWVTPEQTFTHSFPSAQHATSSTTPQQTRP